MAREMTDSQWAAEQASLAFRAGRLDLGWEFARIALRARAVERGVYVPSTAVETATPVLDSLHDSQPVPRLYGRQPDPFGLVAADQAVQPHDETAVQLQEHDPEPVHVQPGDETVVRDQRPTQNTERCRYAIAGHEDNPCWGAVVQWEVLWSDGSTTFVWHHVDQTLDGLHEAVAPSEQPACE